MSRLGARQNGTRIYLPPHLFADSVGSAPEPLGRDGEVVCLVLKGIEAFTSLGNLVNVVPHYTDRVIDLLFFTS